MKIIGRPTVTPTNPEKFSGGEKGLTAEEKKAILFLFKNAGYKTNSPEVYEKVTELETLWAVSYKISYKLTGATASNNASAVVENGAYTSTLTAEGGYTLTGATVKITMGGVDITSTAYKGGVITIESVTGNVVITVAAREIPSFTITNNLTNVTNSNTETKVAEGDFYTATLSWAEGYAINSIAITMGGVDVTADVYGEGKILITEVTGNVVITAEAGIPVLYKLANTPVTCNADLYEDTGLTHGASDATLVTKAWTICATFTRTANCDWLTGINNDACGKMLSIRSNVHYIGHFPRVYWSGGDPAEGFEVSNGTASKLVITHEAKAMGHVTVYAEKNGGVAVKASYAINGAPTNSEYAGNLFVGGATAANFIGTIEDFTIYGTVLPEADIKAYLGVA